MLFYGVSALAFLAGGAVGVLFGGLQTAVVALTLAVTVELVMLARSLRQA